MMPGPDAGNNEEHAGNRLGPTTEALREESALRLFENGAQEELSSSVTSSQRDKVGSDRHTYKQQLPLTTRTTCSTARTKTHSPIALTTRREQSASRARTENSRISKPTPPTRRSTRIAGRERCSKTPESLPEAGKAADKKA